MILGTFLVLSPKVVYLSADIIRNLGKKIENKIFIDGSSFPTTELLLHKNSFFSEEKKEEIRKKISSCFSMKLSSEEEEINDEDKARNRINEAVGQIRQQVGDGRLLLLFNTRYGFWRNLIGGSLITIPFCFINIIVYYLIFHDAIKVIISSIILLVFLVLYASRYKILRYIGRQYAEQLYVEFLGVGTKTNPRDVHII